MKPVDVVVVGGGPAGASAALLLARGGFEVALFDRANFPRDKPCGEFLNPSACDLLSEIFGLSLSDMLASGATIVSRVQLQWSQHDRLEIPMIDGNGAPRQGLTIPRLILDALLLERCREAGVQTHFGHAVRSETTTANEIAVEGTDGGGTPFCCRAKLVCAADGTHSILARNMGFTRPIRRLASIGIVAHLADVPPPAGLESGTWMFPSSGNGVLFGFTRQADGKAVLSAAVPKGFGSQISSDPEAFVRTLIAGHSELVSETAGAKFDRIKTVPCFGHRLRHSFADRMLFLGDAARFVDPFTGEGIHHALESGLLAARCAARALSSLDFGKRTLSAYECSRDELNRRYLLCDVIRSVCVRPFLIEAAGRRMRTNSNLAESIVGALVDIRSARAVLNAGFAWSLLVQRCPNSPRSDWSPRSS